MIWRRHSRSSKGPSPHDRRTFSGSKANPCSYSSDLGAVGGRRSSPSGRGWLRREPRTARILQRHPDRRFGARDGSGRGHPECGGLCPHPEGARLSIPHALAKPALAFSNELASCMASSASGRSRAFRACECPPNAAGPRCRRRRPGIAPPSCPPTSRPAAGSRPGC